MSKPQIVLNPVPNHGHLATAKLIIIMVLGDQWVSSIDRVNSQDKRVIHVPGRREQGGHELHQDTQKHMQFNTCELFIFRIFHFAFLNHGLLEVIESAERKGRPLQAFFFLLILKILNYNYIFLKKLLLFWLKNCKDKKVRLYCRKFRAAFATLLLEGNLESPSETDSCLV